MNEVCKTLTVRELIDFLLDFNPNAPFYVIADRVQTVVLKKNICWGSKGDSLEPYNAHKSKREATDVCIDTTPEKEVQNNKVNKSDDDKKPFEKFDESDKYDFV